MKSKFFDIVNDFNLATYYLLPLLKLNKLSFGAPQNFVNCYVSSKGDCLLIKLRVMMPFLYRNEDFIADYIDEDKLTCIVLRIPEKYTEDVAWFMTGKYSKFSVDARELIRSYSGLIYRQQHPETGRSTTDARLMAIEESEEQRSLLRNKLEDELGCSLPLDAELMSKPSDNNYIQLTEVDYLPTA